jgi:hypothetical protein
MFRAYLRVSFWRRGHGLDTLFPPILGVQADSNDGKVGVEQAGMDPQRHTGVFVPEHPRQCQHDDFGRCRYARADIFRSN